MKNKILIPIVCLAVVVMISCGLVQKAKTYISPGFVAEYYLLDSLVADCYYDTSDTQAPRQHIQLIPFQLYNISYGVRNDKESKEYKEYLRLSEQRGDTEYHKEIASPPPFIDFFGGPRSFFDYDPVK